MSNETKRVLLGSGVLTWARGERVGDRYGHVILYADISYGAMAGFTPATFGEAKAGVKGSLMAIPTETRDSGHIGDLTHGFSPTKPAVGEEILLGSGTVFYETKDDYEAVGLAPEDGGETFWLDPEKLYRAHEQTVDLYFIPDLTP